eukprot:7458458-Pyramimonas_sp.AAC.1
MAESHIHGKHHHVADAQRPQRYDQGYVHDSAGTTTGPRRPPVHPVVSRSISTTVGIWPLVGRHVTSMVTKCTRLMLEAIIAMLAILAVHRPRFPLRPIRPILFF